ncbi:MAG: 4Fe-4S dicluster domain-containing protein [Bryobacteraceae bacterium]
MKTLKMPKDRLDLFASVIQQFGEVHAPVERNGKYAFGPLARWSEARLFYPRTILPLKKYFLPPTETLLEYRPGTGYVPVADVRDRRIVLFGVHACDVYALNILDEVFAGKYPDPYYQRRRENIVIIGVDCIPDEHCFCHSMRADYVDHGFDLFFHDIGDAYLTFVGTAHGDDIVLGCGTLFQPVSRADIEEYKRRSSDKRRSFRLQVDIHDLPEMFEVEYYNEVWEQLGKQCLSCGSCSMVCPTCYCFDMIDRQEPVSGNGHRERTWDSCLYATHALVAGGENFRKGRASRIKFRFYHKQRGFVAEYGRPSCVGCGRCIEACPVHIDIVNVIESVRGVKHAYAQ